MKKTTTKPIPLSSADKIALYDLCKKCAVTVATRALPLLVQDLKEDLEYDLPEEAIMILWQRIYDDIFDMALELSTLKIKPELKQKFITALQAITWDEYKMPVIKSIYIAFRRELKDYKKKHKEDINQTRVKAKEGKNLASRKALYRLIQWDKTWLQFDFVQEYIRSAQNAGDELFFKHLADAIGKKSGVKVKATKDDRALKFITYMSKRIDLAEKGRRKELHDVLVRNGFFDREDGEGASLAFDYNYFKRYLKNHRITE